MGGLPQTLLATSLLASAAWAQSAALPSVLPLPPHNGCAGAADSALADGPVVVGFYDADYATARRACPRSEFGLGGRGGAIIDTPAFYGTLDGDLLLFGSWAFSDRAEVFGTLEAARYAYAQNASLKGSNVGLGQATVGGTYVAWRAGPWTVSPTLRLMLPTSFASATRTAGAELGASGSWRRSSRFDLHGYLGLDGSGGFSVAAADATFGVLVNAGIAYTPRPWVSVVLDLNSHFGERQALDYLAPALAFRFKLWRKLGAELGGTRSLAGADRHLGVVGLKLTYRL